MLMRSEASVDNVKTKPDDPLYEPTENSTADNVGGAGASQAPEGKVINEDAMVAEGVRLPEGEPAVINELNARRNRRVKVPKSKQPAPDQGNATIFFNEEVFSDEVAAQGHRSSSNHASHG